MSSFLLLFIASIYLVTLSDGHGMMVDPVGRASRWRYTNISAPEDYDDNESFCGGYKVQWDISDGKCGLCGDDYRMPTPRPHEYGGLYGEGIIVMTYEAGDTIPVSINVTANHLGNFNWDICNMDNQQESEECFNEIKLELSDGSQNYTLESPENAVYNVTLKIPQNLKCDHCVLRWTYRTGNTWGLCEDGTTSARRCGPQEYFRSCADVAII